MNLYIVKIADRKTRRLHSAEVVASTEAEALAFADPKTLGLPGTAAVVLTREGLGSGAPRLLNVQDHNGPSSGVAEIMRRIDALNAEVREFLGR